ncbi:hypothetical protein ACOSQ3_026861 [Xanthoceras sorbifolium]
MCCRRAGGKGGIMHSMPIRTTNRKLPKLVKVPTKSILMGRRRDRKDRISIFGRKGIPNQLQVSIPRSIPQRRYQRVTREGPRRTRRKGKILRHSFIVVHPDARPHTNPANASL